MSQDALSPHQFGDYTPRYGLTRQEPGYPTKGWQKKSDRVTAQQRLMGAGRGYDVHADAHRKGITPGVN